MKQFTIPFTYRSSFISSIKNKRREQDKMKKDFSPSLINLGTAEIYLARHFGFCYGVENAIEIAFKTIDENTGKRIFLLSEMIHNPSVNADLESRGVRFLQDTKGQQLVSYDELDADDIVLIPAFGTTLDIEAKLKSIGIAIEHYNTTCPFVEKVWNRSKQIAENNFTVVIHGKPGHEETRATFSHAASNSPAVVVNNMAEAELLGSYIKNEKPAEQFYIDFAGRYSDGFDVTKDLKRIGVVNQTTMLASDTQAISDFLKALMLSMPGELSATEKFADTNDTLCYATNDNQSAVYGLLQTEADFAIVVGGYNSSNTSHLVDLCKEKLPTYFINDESKIISGKEILHYDLHKKEEILTQGFIPNKEPIRILITSGASCPDSIVEKVILKLGKIFDAESTLKEINSSFIN
ncbi:MAG: 4-hydroxy-3-methylbut-2-enyl diphosphate reductase [Ferruginibacter sp.]